jgi:hypothetical protein
MTETTQYLAGLGVSVAISLAVVIYMRPHLRTILTELCGTRERAAFWVAFSNVTLCLSPLLFAIRQWPERPEADPPVSQLGGQIGAAIGGLLVAVVALGIVIGKFVNLYSSARSGLVSRTDESKGG